MSREFLINTSIPKNVYPKRNDVDSLFSQRLKLMYDNDNEISRKFIDVVFNLSIKNNGTIPDRKSVAEFIWESKPCTCVDDIPKNNCVGIIDYLLGMKLVLNWPCNTIRSIYYYQVVEHKSQMIYPTRDEYDSLIRNISEISNNFDNYHDKNKIKIGIKLDKFITITNKLSTCGLCHNDIKQETKLYELPCKHTFHIDKKQCLEETNIEQWFNENSKCPICRTDMKTICEFTETELISNISEFKINNIPCPE